MGNEQREPKRGMEPRTLEMPPFGKLWRGRDTWDGKDVLPSWQEFLIEGGPSIGGQAELLIERIGDELVPAAEQVAAYAFVKNNEKEVAAAVLEGIYKHYRELRAQYEEFGEDLRRMPVVKESAQLKKLMELSGVHVLNLAKEGMAYVGFSFACSWDDEHGLGVMVHGKRAISVGDASDSFEVWKAEEDGGKQISSAKDGH